MQEVMKWTKSLGCNVMEDYKYISIQRGNMDIDKERWFRKTCEDMPFSYSSVDTSTLNTSTWSYWELRLPVYILVSYITYR